MSVLSKTVLICCILLLVATLAIHGDFSLDPALPRDMPSDAHFIPTGYDLDHNERKGTWVSCRQDASATAAFCRITDGHGMVIYQGVFLPVRDSQYGSSSDPLSLRVGNEELRWVEGPAEAMSVPLIPMSDGSLLVPAADRQPLVDRWLRDTDEWNRVRVSR
jgi:hypothetical protein